MVEGPDAPEDEQWLLSCTILTGPSPDPDSDSVLGQLSGLHDQMPLPLGSEMLTDWVSPEKLSKDQAGELVKAVRSLAEHVASGWTMWEVDKAVGNIRNNSAELLDPV
ncbi:SOS response-associated peptidase family protein [Nesterenkonia marinintestina]|uniref:SOS response-associated peptidase family protein n=1 Tax=Nesterenkonia marinintestina TaxID=2979865 RepID=UPI0028FC2F6E|nr:SOS response-associated peptidase family protein [Nesterenkonia sp. GX14115]